jgi:hypothetical protein
MWKNNMQAIANIGNLTRPKYVKMPTLDLAGAIDDYYNSKDAATARVDAEAEKQRRQAMVDEMTAQHPEAAAQIAADPMGYAKMLEERAKAERDQQFKMDMLNRQFSNSMALADRQHANSVGLAKLAAQLKGNDTTGMRNIEYLTSLGYSPEEAAQMYYAGNNPTLDMAKFGKKGTEALDKKLGENYAEDLNTYNNLTANLPALETMVKELDALADKGTHTTAGRFTDIALKELFDKTSSGALASAAYQAKVNQNLLPLLRQTLGAAFTEKDREELIKTLGDPYATPAIKKDTLRSFITNKKREIESKKRKLDSYNPQQTGSQTVIDASEYFK